MDKKIFYDSIRKSLFSSGLTEKQVSGIESIIAAIASASKVIPIRDQAYILATAYHETARTMQPVRETLASTDDSAIARLENSFKAGKLTWVKTPYWRKDADGKSWLGRGYVQLTHKYNYEKAGKELGIDLVGNPNLAMVDSTAARILVEGSINGWFTTKKLSDYTSFTGKRYVINGTDKATTIAGYAEKFLAALTASGEIPKDIDSLTLPKAPEKPVETIVVPPVVDVPTVAPSEPTNLLELIIKLVVTLFKGAK